MYRKFLPSFFMGVFLSMFIASTAMATDLNYSAPSSLAKFVPLEQKGLLYLTDSSAKLTKFLINPNGVLSLSKRPVSVKDAGRIFFKDYGKYFGVKNFTFDVRYLQIRINSSDRKYLVYEQLYKGVPVYGGSMVVSVKPDLSISHAGGKIQQNISVKTTPSITLARGKSAALKYAKNLGLSDPAVTASKLYVFNKNFLNPVEPGKNYLVWKMEVVDQDGFGREYIFVDANSGKVVYNMTGVKSINRNVCDCRTNLGCHTGRRVVCGANERAEGDAVYGATDVDNLYDELEQAHNYFSTTHGLNGANNKGGIGDGSAAYPSANTDGFAYHIPTSTWGGCPNSYWTGYGVTFCTNLVMYPLVGHEYGHAVNEFNASSRLDYQLESGQIEEGLADIWGAAVERYATGNTNWQFGPGAGRPVWRDIISLINQTGKAPSTTFDANYQCMAAGDVPVLTNDFGFVHDNSVVLSHMAYMLSEGGSFNGCDIAGIGHDKMERLFFLVLPDLVNNSDFNDLYVHLLAECNAEYGLGSPECVAVIRAGQAAMFDQGTRCAGAVSHAPLCQLTFIKAVNNNWGDTFSQFFRLAPTPSLDSDFTKDLTQPKVDLPPVTPTTDVAPIPPTIEPHIDVPPLPPVVDNSVSTPAVNSETITPPPVAEREVTKPSFTVDVVQNGKNVTINGVLDYYGKGSRCSGPRYFDPIIVRWGQVDSHPTLNSDNTFTASHDYIVRNPSYDLSVSVFNSCFDHTTFNKTIFFSL